MHLHRIILLMAYANHEMRRKPNFHFCSEIVTRRRIKTRPFWRRRNARNKQQVIENHSHDRNQPMHKISTVQPCRKPTLFAANATAMKMSRMTNYFWINNSKPGDAAKKKSIEKLKLIVHCPMSSLQHDHRNKHNAHKDTVNRFLK